MQEISDNSPTRRSIRSYVIRAGRITLAQERALRQQWPRYGIAFVSQPLDLPQLFGRRAPCSLEIGFGNGEHLIERAQREPERDFLGIEVHRPGIGHLLLAAERAGINNLRVIEHDAVEVLERQIPPGGLDEVQLLFPDPWPKKRHHKRRLVQPAFVALVAACLRRGGRFQLATDWEPYAEQMLACLRECPSFASPIEDLDVMARTSTRFERRGERLGHRIRELLFIKSVD